MADQTEEHCDLETGLCGPVGDAPQDALAAAHSRAGILYFTDPICSHCWATEPAWRRLMFLYGAQFSVRHVYGGLLPSWEGFRDRSAGIGAPADVASHWTEVAERYGQPINPAVWLNDPLPSSFPPSVAAHTVRIIAPDLEDAFLRRIRQAVFLEARNIARVDVLRACADDVHLDPDQFQRLYEVRAGVPGFERDRAEVRELGVRGFPTIMVSGPKGSVRLRGTQSFDTLDEAVVSSLGIQRSRIVPSTRDALKALGSGTLREFSTLLDIPDDAAEQALAAVGASQSESGVWRAPAQIPSSRS